MPRPRKNPKGEPVAFDDTLGNLEKGTSHLVMVNLKIPADLRDDMRKRAFEVGTSMTQLLLGAYRRVYLERSGASRKPSKRPVNQ